MAVTLHFCAKDQQRRLVIRSRLGAFRHVQGSHDGPTLASHFIEILEELGLSHKVCQFKAIIGMPLLSMNLDWHDHTRQRIEQWYDDGRA